MSGSTVKRTSSSARKGRGKAVASTKYPSCLAAAQTIVLRADEEVRFTVEPDIDAPTLRAGYLGFTTEFSANGAGMIAQVEALVGEAPSGIRLFGHGRAADQLLSEARAKSLPLEDRRSYPERV